MQQQLIRADDSGPINGKGESKEVSLVKEVIDPDNSPISKENNHTSTRETKESGVKESADNLDLSN